MKRKIYTVQLHVIQVSVAHRVVCLIVTIVSRLHFYCIIIANPCRCAANKKSSSLLRKNGITVDFLIMHNAGTTLGLMHQEIYAFPKIVFWNIIGTKYI